jgi:hypothetical protein
MLPTADAFHAMQAPHITIETTQITLKTDTRSLEVENEGQGDAVFVFRGYSGSADPKNSALSPAIPLWLNIHPTCGIVPSKGKLNVLFTVNKVAASFLSTDTKRSTIEVGLVSCSCRLTCDGAECTLWHLEHRVPLSTRIHVCKHGPEDFWVLSLQRCSYSLAIVCDLAPSN